MRRRAASPGEEKSTGGSESRAAVSGGAYDPAVQSAGADSARDPLLANFSGHARDAMDWVARYLEEVERYPVLSRARPGEMRAALPLEPPRSPEPFARILADFESRIIPGITHWNHPGFMAYFAITGSAPGILGELLTAALNVNGMLWRTSPAATELEQVTLDWLRQMIGLDAGWFGMITDTASMSTLIALAAARERRGELNVRELGLAGRTDLPVMRVYVSEEAHSAAGKAVITLGLGARNVVHVPTDDEFRMRPDALRAAITEDRSAGRLPLAVVATVGTTSTTSVDPVPEIGRICREEDVWLHVDAAYAGAAAIVPELRWLMDGVDAADSLVLNPHKWLFTPIDCSALYVRRPDELRRVFSLAPEILASAGHGDAPNLMDYGVQLGRRFRALKLWMVIRAFGVDGLVECIRHHVRLAQLFAEWVSLEPYWRVMAPHPLSAVCFRYEPEGVSAEEADRINERILERVNASGEVLLSHTRLRGRFVLRLAVGNLATQREHLARAWELLTKSTED